MIFAYFLLGIPLLYLFYKWATINKKYFANRNVKSLRNPLPIFGHTGGAFFGRHRFHEFVDSVYYQYPEEK